MRSNLQCHSRSRTIIITSSTGRLVWLTLHSLSAEIMSASCEASSTYPIPSRSVVEKTWSQLPESYNQTPGGTLFSTTPGGTRIIYERKFLLEFRNSPIARTPPCCLPHIPGVTITSVHPAEQDDDNKDVPVDDSQFVMDM
ncbi:eukaryotic translation initiation factor 4E-binding protein 3 [Triplophysa rosa]|uniref:eukaryotic translation initiation factor 4E-binding protein 3 n=1 Tax=Triplophysa rosa TaxID=992332 RepID=UPI0025460063|nr:eukaryotic translation initiation factor 4E-binding protein 3 [Triplophysa rosa]